MARLGAPDVDEFDMGTSLFLRKQNGLVILGTVENVYDVDGIDADATENQVIAAGAAPDTEMLVARH
jgi:hypothetical protein